MKTPVMSSCLCKKLEGAVFPFQVEPLEDGVNDAVHALDVDEADHGPGSASDFDEAALDDIGGAELAPQMPGEAEERQQLRQIPFQLPDHGGIMPLPAGAEAPEGGLRLLAVLSLVDRLGVRFDLVMIATPHFLQDIAHLVHPAALMQGAGINRLDRSGQTGTAIGHD